jgi:type II secretory pathway predicted ATPase ExeA
MFLDFYQMRQQPFGVTPDPAYLYPSPTHREALACLLSGIREGRGFFALIAPPGMGKTTLLYQLLEELHDSARTAFLFQTQCDSRELLQYLLNELRIDPQGMDVVEMHGKLNEVLFAEMIAGRRFVLVVDEAQNLTDSALETVRMLSNFETSHTKLLQIVLAGQPQLAERLAQPQLSQLRQRIAVRTRLQPFSADETACYIDHRLKVGGYTGESLFDSEALALIAERSQGIPRNINNICYDALAIARRGELRVVTSDVVKEAVSRLEIEPLPAEALAISVPGELLAAPQPAAPRAPLPLTYEAPKKLHLPRWDFRAVVFTGALFLAGMLLIPVLKFTAPGQARAESQMPRAAGTAVQPPNATAQLPANYSADPQQAGPGQILTVAAMPRQTLKDISLLYVGRFDSDLQNQIFALNPGLTDPDHLAPGQLIRLPLPPGSFKKGEEITPTQK